LLTASISECTFTARGLEPADDLTCRIAVRWMVRNADMTTKLTPEIITAAIEGFDTSLADVMT
jgi:hypothetical protein